jgi:hypothetical protein
MRRLRLLYLPASADSFKTTRPSRGTIRFFPQTESTMRTCFPLVQTSVPTELDAAAAAESRGQFHTAFRHLERAHVLAQPSTREHVRVHWRMLHFALRGRRSGDAFGQAWRLVAALCLTWLGLVPPGNTGGSRVNGFRPMPVPPELQTALDCTSGAERNPLRVQAFRRRVAMVAIGVLAATGMLVLGGCGSPPRDLDMSLEKPSAAGRYRIALVPPVPAVAVNRMHSWQVRLASTDGQLVSGARFAVDGGMPQHGHGLPTQPRVTRESVPGTYSLDGMKFSMPGWWQLRFAIDGATGGDTVSFNILIGDPGARP